VIRRCAGLSYILCRLGGHFFRGSRRLCIDGCPGFVSQDGRRGRNGESTFGDVGTVVLRFNCALGVIGIYVEGIEPGADVVHWAEVLVMVSLLSPGA